MEYDLTKKTTKKRLIEFAEELKKISEKVGFKQSARGWCYQLEVEGLITKAEFNKVENIINRCRRNGTLPIDFTAEEQGRQFSGVEKPDSDTPIEDLRYWVENTLTTENRYNVNWWEGEEYYIQMVVEKIDLKTLFLPVCEEYHIPIATSSGWSSMKQRAIYARRFKEAEEKGLKNLLLYCGDHDPDGLRISEFIRKNLVDLKDIEWGDGEEGYDPENLEILRFGLNYDFIVKHKLSWINNLITGSKGCIAEMKNGKIVQGKTANGRPHQNFKMPYAQEYLKKYGVRKCEANAIVTIPQVARDFVEGIIQKYVGEDAKDRFAQKRQEVVDEVTAFRKKTGLDKSLKKALKLIDEDQE